MVAVVEARVLRRVRHAPHTESVQGREGGMNELCLRMRACSNRERRRRDKYGAYPLSREIEPVCWRQDEGPEA